MVELYHDLISLITNKDEMFLLPELTLLVGEVGMSSFVELILVICYDYFGVCFLV